MSEGPQATADSSGDDKFMSSEESEIESDEEEREKRSNLCSPLQIIFSLQRYEQWPSDQSMTASLSTSTTFVFHPSNAL